MAEAKAKLLIVEDDLDIAEMLNAYFQVQGYEVFTVKGGKDGVLIGQNSLPDLVILDIRLPDIDGFEVARRLRSNRKTQNIPIIFLTEKHELADRLLGLELGADDYIGKPFDIQELRLRVRNAMRRAKQDSLTNPVTGLPDGSLVDEHLGECLQREHWNLLMISLEGLKGFREAYGFVASDDVLRAVGLMIHNAMEEIGSPDGFLGHLSPNDFLLIAPPEIVSTLQERISTRLGQSLDYFYPIRDREKATSSRSRLGVRTSLLSAGEGNYDSLEQLKMAMLHKMK